MSTKVLQNKAWVFQDTDLLSTIGYHRIFGSDKRVNLKSITDNFEFTKSDLYVVMPDDIPFEPDILRYGDGVRESKTQFWIDLLEEYGCKYVTVPSGDHEYKARWLKDYLEEWYDATTNGIRWFERRT